MSYKIEADEDAPTAAFPENKTKNRKIAKSILAGENFCKKCLISYIREYKNSLTQINLNPTYHTLLNYLILLLFFMLPLLRKRVNSDNYLILLELLPITQAIGKVGRKAASPYFFLSYWKIVGETVKFGNLTHRVITDKGQI